MSAPKAIALLLVLIAAGLAAGWFLLGMGEDPSGLELSEQESLNLSGRNPSASEAGQASLTRAEEGSDATKVETIGSMPFAEESEATRGYAYSVRVVDKDDQPIAGAEVEFQDWAGSRDLFSMSPKLKPQVIQKMRSGTDGRAFLKHPPRSGLRVCGRRGELEGRVSIEASALAIGESKTLKLLPRRKVIARVRDASGAPIPHAFAKMSQRYFLETSGSGWTDADGIARFEVSAMDRNIYKSKQCQVQAALPSGVHSSEKVEWAEGGPTEVEIVVKRPLTLLKIEVHGDDGKLDTSEHTVSWSEPNRPQDANNLMMFGGGILGANNESRSRTFTGGQIAFAGFRAGAKIELTLASRGRVEETKIVKLPKPQVEMQHVILTLGSPAPVAIIPLVNERGEPLSGKKFSVSAQAKSSTKDARSRFEQPVLNGNGEKMVVDSSGHLSVELKVNEPSTIEVREVLVSSFWGATNEPLTSFDVPPLAPGERRTLEPITISDPPLLAAGKVTNSQGEPQAGVLVSVLKFPGGRQSNSWSVNNLLQSARVRTGPDGMFELYSRVNTDGLRLIAVRSGKEKSLPTPFDSGDQDVAIELKSSGGIAVEVRRAIAEKRLDILCSFQDVALDGSIGYFARDLRQRKSLKADTTTHEFSSLLPGTYDVSFKAGGVKLMTVDQVVVKAGVVTRDPRLLGLTPDEGFMLGKVTVQDSSGQPIKGATVAFSMPRETGPAKSKRRVESTSNKDGVASIVCRVGTIADLHVRCKGFLPVRKKQVPLPAEVTLGSGATLMVVVDAQGDFPSSERIKSWSVSLRPKPKKKAANTRANKALLDALMEASRKGDSGLKSSSVRLDSSYLIPGRGGASKRHSQKLSPDGKATIRGIAEGEYEVYLRANVSRKQSVGWGPDVFFGNYSGNSAPPGIKIGEIAFPEGSTEVQTGRFSIDQDWLLAQVAKAEAEESK